MVDHEVVSRLVCHQPPVPHESGAIVCRHLGLWLSKHFIVFHFVDRAMAETEEGIAKQAWRALLIFYANNFLMHLEATLDETMKHWDIIKGDRVDWEPSDALERAFWMGVDPKEWLPAMSACMWAKATRLDITNKFMEINKFFCCYNLLFREKWEWPGNQVDDMCSEVFYFLDPLQLLDRLDEIEVFNASCISVPQLSDLD